MATLGSWAGLMIVIVSVKTKVIACCQILQEVNWLIDVTICDVFCETNATFASCGMESTERLLYIRQLKTSVRFQSRLC